MARRILYNQTSISNEIELSPNPLDSTTFNQYAVQSTAVSGSISKDVIFVGHIYDQENTTLELRGESWKSPGTVAGLITASIGSSVSNTHTVISTDKDNPDVFTISMDLTGSGYTKNTTQNILVNMQVSGSLAYFGLIDPSGSIAGDFTMPTVSMVNPTIYMVGDSSGSSGNHYINAGGAASTNPDGYVFFHREISAGNEDDEGAWLKWDGTNDRFEMNDALIVTNNIAAHADFYTNFTGPDGDSFVYFYNQSSNVGASLKWDDGNNEFQLSHDLTLVADVNATNIEANSALFTNFNGSGADGYVYFYDGSPTGASIMYDGSETQFVFSGDINAPGMLSTAGIISSGSLAGNSIQAVSASPTSTNIKILNTQHGDAILYMDASNGDLLGSDYTSIGQLDSGPLELFLGSSAASWQMNFKDSTTDLVRIQRTGTTLQSAGDIGINYDGADADSYLYFYNNGSATDRSLKWDNANDRFEINDALIGTSNIAAQGNLYVNFGGPDGLGRIFFHEDSSDTGASIQFTGDTTSVFNHTHDIEVAGDPVSNTPYGELYEHADGGSIITVTTADTYYGWVTAASGSFNSMTADLLNGSADHMIIQKAGMYAVNGAVSLDGEVNSVVDGAVFLNGTIQQNLHFHRDMGTAAAEGAAGVSGLLACAVDDEISFRFTSDSNGDNVTVFHINLNMFYLTN